MRFGTFHLIGAPEMQSGEQRIGETVDQIVLADSWARPGLGRRAPLLQLRLRDQPAAGHRQGSRPDPASIRFGQAIIVTPFWHPLRLAEDIALTDILTDGRLDIGLGRGYQKMEFDGFDISLDDSRAHVRRTARDHEEGLDRGRLHATRASYFTVPRPITVLPGARSRSRIPRSGRLPERSDRRLDGRARLLSALLGLPVQPRADLRLASALPEAGQAAGHADPNPRLAVQRFVYVCDSEEEARAALWQTRWQRRVADHLKNNRERIVAGRNEAYEPPTESSDDEWWDRLRLRHARARASPSSSATPTLASPTSSAGSTSAACRRPPSSARCAASPPRSSRLRRRRRDGRRPVTRPLP